MPRLCPDDGHPFGLHTISALHGCLCFSKSWLQWACCLRRFSFTQLGRNLAVPTSKPKVWGQGPGRLEHLGDSGLPVHVLHCAAEFTATLPCTTYHLDKFGYEEAFLPSKFLQINWHDRNYWASDLPALWFPPGSGATPMPHVNQPVVRWLPLASKAEMDAKWWHFSCNCCVGWICHSHSRQRSALLTFWPPGPLLREYERSTLEGDPAHDLWKARHHASPPPPHHHHPIKSITILIPLNHHFVLWNLPSEAPGLPRHVVHANAATGWRQILRLLRQLCGSFTYWYLQLRMTGW